MISLPTGTIGELRDLIWKHHPINEICPCIDTFTAKIILGEHKKYDDGSCLVHCNIDPFPFGGNWPGGICEAIEPKCKTQHVMQTDFWMRISDETWYKQVSFEKEVLLYNAKNRPWDAQPHVDARGYQSAIVRMTHQDIDLDEMDPGKIRCSEFCMGAFSGWSHVITTMNDLGIDIHHEWGIDIDPICCQCASKTHHLDKIYSSQQFRDTKLTKTTGIRPLFQADVRESWYLQHVASGELEMSLLSPPCQPWTSAVKDAKGLSRKDGMTMVWCWARNRILQPKFVIMEMVANIVNHPHWRVIQQIIAWCGYDIISIETLQLSDIIPQSRRRVLLIACRHGLGISLENFRWMTWPCGKKHSLRSFGCICDEPDSFAEQPFLGDQLLQIYLDPKVAPKEMRDDTSGKLGNDLYRRVRLKTIDECVFPCIVANYTKAHHLLGDILQQSGLFGGLLLQGARPRFLTSPEIFVLMGGLVPSWLPTCKDARIHVLGNCISVPHAAIAILNVIALFKHTISREEIHETFAKIFSCRIHNGNMAIRISEEGMFIGKSEHDHDEIPPTVPMRTFAQVTVKSPTECFRFWIEPHVSIVGALQILLGPSFPSRLEIHIHGKTRIPLHWDDTCETCGMEILSAVPCILHFDDAKFTQHDSAMIAILSHDGPVIIERKKHEIVESIEKTMRDHFPMGSIRTQGCVKLINALGVEVTHGSFCGAGIGQENCPTKSGPHEHACPDMSILAIPCRYALLSQHAFEGIHCKIEMGCITLQAPGFQIDTFLRNMQRIGLETVLHAVGWMLVMIPPPTDWQARSKILLVKKPLTLACTTESLQMLLLSRIAVSLLPLPSEHVHGHLRIRIKIWQFMMWQGSIPHDCTPFDFMKQWDFASEFVGVDLPLRAILKGRRANPDFSFRELLQTGHDEGEECDHLIKLHLLTGLQGGGNKNDELIQAKNSVAVFLLGKGADLQQTSHFADVITRSMGIVAIQRLMSIPDIDDRMNALQQGAQKLHIKWPHFPKGEVENMKATKNTIAKKGNKNQTVLKAESFKLINDNIVNEDGSTCMVRNDVAPNAAGIVLMDSEIAQQWLQDFKIISQDEVAILSLGHQCLSSDSAKCQPVQVSALGPNGHPAILRCCLHNLGAKQVRIKPPKNDQVKAASSTIVSITIFRDETTGQDWKQLIEHPVKYALESLEIDESAAMVSPPWGRSWMNGKTKCEPQQSISFQCHTRIPLTKVEYWMRKSGQHGVYVIPRNEDGTLNPKYMVIWMDQGAIELSKTAVDLHKHLGLVRISKNKGESMRTSRGIRFAQEDFAEAWASLRPNESCPDTIPIRWIYKISPTPTAATMSDLKEWLRLLGWKAKPIKGVGPKSWLVGAEEKQEQVFLSWNGQSILAKLVENEKKNHVSPVLAGNIPKQKDQGRNVFLTGNPHDDPWANYQPQQPYPHNMTLGSNASKPQSVPSRQVEAPIEKRFQSQDMKIDELAVQIAKLQSMHDTTKQDMEGFKAEVHHEFKAVRIEAQKQFESMNQSFEASLEKAMNRQDRSMQQSFQELRLPMMNQPNPAKKAKATPRDGKDGEDEDVNL